MYTKFKTNWLINEVATRESAVSDEKLLILFVGIRSKYSPPVNRIEILSADENPNIKNGLKTIAFNI